jgi:hypothetical protein
MTRTLGAGGKKGKRLVRPDIVPPDVRGDAGRSAAPVDPEVQMG